MTSKGSDKVRRAGLAAGTALALIAPAMAAFASVPNTIPLNTQELRDFRIDPQPPAPPAPTPAPAPVPTPAPVVDTPAPEPVAPPVAERTAPPADAAPVRTRQRPGPVSPAPVPTPRSTREGTGTPDAVDDSIVDTPIDETPVAEIPAQPVETAPVSQIDSATGPLDETSTAAESPTDDANSSSLLPIALGSGALALLGALLWRRRRRSVVVAENSFAEVVHNAMPTDEPDPSTQLVPTEPETVSPVIEADAHARPMLTLAFKPAAAGATDAMASVEYTLLVTNEGDAPASKVRMEARMFAMGPDHDAALAAFFAAPLERPTPIASAMPPGVEAVLRAQVTLPRVMVNPIQVRDRTVFVPLVAFNILYEYYDPDGGLQHGQTAMSYVVGRENRPPAEKMAPFRLDQGPRIYREVGQRVHQLRQLA